MWQVLFGQIIIFVPKDASMDMNWDNSNGIGAWATIVTGPPLLFAPANNELATSPHSEAPYHHLSVSYDLYLSFLVACSFTQLSILYSINIQGWLSPVPNQSFFSIGFQFLFSITGRSSSVGTAARILWLEVKPY